MLGRNVRTSGLGTGVRVWDSRRPPLVLGLAAASQEPSVETEWL